MDADTSRAQKLYKSEFDIYHIHTVLLQNNHFIEHIRYLNSKNRNFMVKYINPFSICNLYNQHDKKPKYRLYGNNGSKVHFIKYLQPWF